MSEQQYITVVLPDADDLHGKIFSDDSPLGRKAVGAGVGNYIGQWFELHERVEQLESYITNTLGEPLPPQDSPND